mmetsp:Transcript_11021/g.30464  ORF Transcript_11021/g.30464 Transcript_11021/m.30464 type:complete len:1007 (+) Transcript_11021:80-3100(+)
MVESSKSQLSRSSLRQQTNIQQNLSTRPREEVRKKPRQSPTNMPSIQFHSSVHASTRSLVPLLLFTLVAACGIVTTVQSFQATPIQHSWTSRRQLQPTTTLTTGSNFFRLAPESSGKTSSLLLLSSSRTSSSFRKTSLTSSLQQWSTNSMTKTTQQRQQLTPQGPTDIGTPRFVYQEKETFPIRPADDDPKGNPNPATTLQEQLQRQSAAISTAFEAGTFDPLWTNCHVQTILGFFFRDTPAAYLPRNNLWAAAARIAQSVVQLWQRGGQRQQENDFWDERERIATPDGDWFHADTKLPQRRNQQQQHQQQQQDQQQRGSSSGSGNPTAVEKHVIVIHGLESNSNSSLSQQIAQSCYDKLGPENTRVTCLNFRSCSIDGTGNLLLNDLPGAYHLGFTDDLMHYLKLNRQRLSEQGKTQEIYLTGFSLGANVVLKALGELSSDAQTVYNIQGAAVGCAPFEQETNARALAQPGINRIIYTNNLLTSLKAKAIDNWNRFGDTSNPVDQAAVQNYTQQQTPAWKRAGGDSVVKMESSIKSFSSQYEFSAADREEVKQVKEELLQRARNKDANIVTAGIVTALLTQALFPNGVGNAVDSIQLALLVGGVSSYVSAADNEEDGLGNFLRSLAGASNCAMDVLKRTFSLTAKHHQSRLQESMKHLIKSFALIDGKNRGLSELGRKQPGSSEATSTRSGDNEPERNEPIVSSLLLAARKEFTTGSTEILVGVPKDTVLVACGVASVLVAIVVGEAGGSQGLMAEAGIATSLLTAYSSIHQGFVGNTLRFVGNVGVTTAAFGSELVRQTRIMIASARSVSSAKSWSKSDVSFTTDRIPRLSHEAQTSEISHAVASSKHEPQPSPTERRAHNTACFNGRRHATLLEATSALHIHPPQSQSGKPMRATPLFATDRPQSDPALIREKVKKTFVTRSIQQWVVKAMIEKLHDARKRELFDLPQALAAETITQFDNSFIAPIYGFKDCWDYYRKTSSTFFLERITVPTLTINSKDDPFF